MNRLMASAGAFLAAAMVALWCCGDRARCPANKKCRGRACCISDAYMGRLEEYRRDWWVPRREKLSGLLGHLKRGRRLYVQRSARKKSAERSASFHTSTEPFYAVRRAGAAACALAAEHRPETPGSAVQPRRAPAADATAPQHDGAGGAQRPNQRNRPAKASRGRAPGTRARAKIHRAHPRRRHTQLFTSLCAWKRAQNLAFSRTSHP